MPIKQTKENYNESDYLSVNAFKGKRKSINLMQLRSFYLDLDILSTITFEKITDDANNHYFGYNGYDKDKLINNYVHDAYIKLITNIC